MKYREQIAGASGFTEINLPADARQHALQNLKVFARYGIKVAAKNEKGPGPFTPVYDVTTGEKRKWSCYPLAVTTNIIMIKSSFARFAYPFLVLNISQPFLSNQRQLLTCFAVLWAT